MYIAGFPRMLFLRIYVYILKTSIDTSQESSYWQESQDLCSGTKVVISALYFAYYQMLSFCVCFLSLSVSI